jgi:hypothetical protein
MMTDEQAGREVQRGDEGAAGERGETRVVPVAPVPSVGGMSVGGHISGAAGGLTQPIGGLIPAPGRGEAGAFDDAGDIASRVEGVLAQDGRIRMTNVVVTVERGVVDLSGSVSTERERKDAEEVSARVPGVRSVQNRLTVV